MRFSRGSPCRTYAHIHDMPSQLIMGSTIKPIGHTINPKGATIKSMAHTINPKGATITPKQDTQNSMLLWKVLICRKKS